MWRHKCNNKCLEAEDTHRLLLILRREFGNRMHQLEEENNFYKEENKKLRRIADQERQLSTQFFQELGELRAEAQELDYMVHESDLLLQREVQENRRLRSELDRLQARNVRRRLWFSDSSDPDPDSDFVPETDQEDTF